MVVVVIQFLARSLPQVAEVAEAVILYQDLVLLPQEDQAEVREVVHQIVELLEMVTHHLFHHLKVILAVHQALVHQAILVEEAEAVLQQLVELARQTIITAEMVELVLHLTSQEVLLLEQVAEAEAL